jgi:hypothetical protein
MKSVAACVLLFSIAAPSGSEPPIHPITLTDLSGADCPLKSSGKASFQEVTSDTTIKVSYGFDVDFVNVGFKPILAYEASLDLNSDHGAKLHSDDDVDFFFSSDALLPGSNIKWVEEPSRWIIVPYREVPPTGKPAAILRVTFVEFVDGTRFGNSVWGDKLAEQRKAGRNCLNALADAYESDKKNGLANAVRTQMAQLREFGGTVHELLREVKETLDSKGVPAATAEIRSRLDNAQKHMDAR